MIETYNILVFYQLYKINTIELINIKLFTSNRCKHGLRCFNASLKCQGDQCGTSFMAI